MVSSNIQELLDFLDGSRSVYHAVACVIRELEKDGFTPIYEGEHWKLEPGGKYYVTRGSSSLIAFRIPQTEPVGFMMSASHSDRPTFKLKDHNHMQGEYTRLAVERYGGLILNSWLDRPLSVAGRVMVETEKGVETKLVDIDRDLMLMPSVAIHMNRKVNEGYAYNPGIDTIPLMGSKKSAGKLKELIDELAGGEALGHDLYLYVRQKASVWGLDDEYISAQALDDLQCTYGCAKGFLHANASRSVPVLAVLDSEEVGSCSAQGAGSTFLADVLERICETCHWEYRKMLGHSFLVSADNAHALHPNHPELADPANAPKINEGVVLKYNGALRYTTDGLSAAVFRKICAKADVPVQTYYNRPDIEGGATLGRISLGKVSVPTADIGLPQLAMHSAYETSGVEDTEWLIKAMTEFFSTTLTMKADGNYELN